MANPIDWQRKTSTLLEDGTSLNSPYEQATTVVDLFDSDSLAATTSVEVFDVTGKGILLGLELMGSSPDLGIILYIDNVPFRTTIFTGAAPASSIIHSIERIHTSQGDENSFFKVTEYDAANGDYFMFLKENFYFNSRLNVYIHNLNAAAQDYAYTIKYRIQ